MADQAFEFSAKLEFRPMKDDDVQDLQTYCFSNKTIDEIKEEISQDLDRIEKGEVFRIIADAGGHAIGQVRIERATAQSTVANVGGLYVSAPFRAFGVSAKLIESAVKTASENEIETLEIEVMKSDVAIIDAYRNWGFEERPTIILQKSITVGGSNEVPDVLEDKLATDEDDGELSLGNNGSEEVNTEESETISEDLNAQQELL
ncbi:MAG: GNAT family N-acetyltransferase [Candidatus Poribacteria bacterium]|nr:GNAT family N-acetyltransferase [Candidatus Poribacteria bacterium]